MHLAAEASACSSLTSIPRCLVAFGGGRGGGVRVGPGRALVSVALGPQWGRPPRVPRPPGTPLPRSPSERDASFLPAGLSARSRRSLRRSERPPAPPRVRGNPAPWRPRPDEATGRCRRRPRHAVPPPGRGAAAASPGLVADRAAARHRGPKRCRFLVGPAAPRRSSGLPPRRNPHLMGCLINPSVFPGV